MNRIFQISRLALPGILLLILVSGQALASGLRLALVLDKGGKDDKSFNTAAYQGAFKAKQELNAYLKYVEATDDSAFEPLIRAFALKNFDLIIAIGAAQAEAVRKAAIQFPSQKFAIVDAEIQAPLVKSILFNEHEGAFLVGAIAAQVSKTGTVGFIGGMDIPLIRRFELGYISGARTAHPRVKVISNFIGVTADAWNNPTKAKELAVSQYDSGADVIFGAAGASGSGLFDAAEEKKKFAIGVDSNQNGVRPGYVLTSMVKKVDQAIYLACKEVLEGKFQGGVQKLGLANQGVDYIVDSYNEKLLPEAVRKKTNELKAGIISGKIRVPDYYQKRK